MTKSPKEHMIFQLRMKPGARYGEYIKNNIQLSKKPSWVRHDEHYHVDFKMECKAMVEK